MSENVDIFTALDGIYLVFDQKKVNFLFILLNRNTESTT